MDRCRLWSAAQPLPAPEHAKEEDLFPLEVAERTKRGRILLSEDETITGLLIEGHLKKLGHEFVYTSNADEALAQFSPGEYDIAIIDLGIPGRPGDELARLFKEKDPHIRTLLVTGWDINEDDSRRQPFDLYVKKPFDVRRIGLAVTQLLSQEKS
jgi:DNA-binding response OmpR family regulator